MEKSEVVLDKLIIALIVISALYVGYWYFSELGNTKSYANNLIGKMRDGCAEFAKQENSCNVIQSHNPQFLDGICSKRLTEHQEKVLDRIMKSPNLFEVKALTGLRPANELEVLSGETSLGDLIDGFNFYLKTNSVKMRALENIYAFNSAQCELYKTPLKNYAYCDLQYARSYLLKNEKEISRTYLKKAEQAFNSEDYLSATYYTTAAIAYQDKSSRDGYGDLIEAGENGLVC